MKYSAERALRALVIAAAFGYALAAHADPVVTPYQVAGDAIPVPLAGTHKADAARGREIVLSRHTGLCLLCHSGPFPDVRLQGNLAPSLAGVGARLSTGQIRLRIVDPARLNPDSIMPSYFRSEGFARVAPAYRGKSVLNAQQIEDVVAFVATLREP